MTPLLHSLAKGQTKVQLVDGPNWSIRPQWNQNQEERAAAGRSREQCFVVGDGRRHGLRQATESLRACRKISARQVSDKLGGGRRRPGQVINSWLRAAMERQA